MDRKRRSRELNVLSIANVPIYRISSQLSIRPVESMKNLVCANPLFFFLQNAISTNSWRLTLYSLSFIIKALFVLPIPFVELGILKKVA
jgi:hypothetical protein